MSGAGLELSIALLESGAKTAGYGGWDDARTYAPEDQPKRLTERIGDFLRDPASTAV